MSIVRNVALPGPAERRAGDRVDLLDGVAAARDRFERADDAVERDVVADEVRRVLRDDDALAEMVIGEVGGSARRRPDRSPASG